MIHSTKIKAIDNSAIKDGTDDRRTIPQGLFKPHMTTLISGKTGSGKSTALIRMLKAYCDAGVFQKVVLISPTASYDLESQIRDNQSEIKAFIKVGKANDARVQQLEADNTTPVNELQDTRARDQSDSSRLQGERDQAYRMFADLSRDLEVLEARNKSLTEELSRSRTRLPGWR